VLVYQLASQFFLVDVGIVEARIINYFTSVKLSKIQGGPLRAHSSPCHIQDGIQAVVVSGSLIGTVSSTRLSLEY
jgi:hypothetical protein